MRTPRQYRHLRFWLSHTPTRDIVLTIVIVVAAVLVVAAAYQVATAH